MASWLQTHWESLVALAAILAVTWMFVRSTLLSRMGHGLSRRVTAYCGHCNWEGVVVLGDMRCARCGSHRMNVLSTGAHHVH